MTARDIPTPRKGRCCWCDGPLSGRQRRWCSVACLDDYGPRASGQIARTLVERRDQGVCAGCGRDTRRLEAAVGRLLRTWGSRAQYADFRGYVDRRQRLVRVLGRMGLRAPHWTARGFDQHTWEADHIVPVCEGGGCCGLDNLRTLCLPCHRAETAVLAGRRRQ